MAGHPAYEPSQFGEWTCYRSGVLAFEEVASLEGLREPREAAASVDPDGSVDYGEIGGLRVEGGAYRFNGEMGHVVVRASRLRVYLSERLKTG